MREKQSPDGDSMRFVADDMSLFHGLPHYSPPSQAGGQESYQLRFQSIDTPELHYGGAAQPHGLESRDQLLRWLGVDPAGWDWVVAPKGFSWQKKAAILCNAFEGHGRPIAFVLKSIDLADGADVKLTPPLLEKTYNYQAVKTGSAYLGLYSGGLTADIQTEFITAYKTAHRARKGIWKLDRTRRFMVNMLADLSPEHGSLIYPKIFRRCVDALRWVGGEFSPGHDLDDFLKNSPQEDDRFIAPLLHGGHVTSQLSAAIEQINNQIKIDVDLNTVDFVPK